MLKTVKFLFILLKFKTLKTRASRINLKYPVTHLMFKRWLLDSFLCKSTISDQPHA